MLQRSTRFFLEVGKGEKMQTTLISILNTLLKMAVEAASIRLHILEIDLGRYPSFWGLLQAGSPPDAFQVPFKPFLLSPPSTFLDLPP